MQSFFRMPQILKSRQWLLAGLASVMMPSVAATLQVGPTRTFDKPCAAFAAAQAGDIVEIDAATYVGDVCGIYPNNLVIRGVGGRPKIDASGNNAMGKGTWVVEGSNVTVENVEMYGATVADQNGAALRLEGVNFTLRGSFLHDNENGVLGGSVSTASNILIETSEFGHNGYGDGYSHNVYISNVDRLTFRYNFSHDANVGHNLKSRARINTILYNRFSSTPPGQIGSTASGQPSYEIDLPNAGTSYVIGNVIEQPSANQNPTMLAYGEEGASNPGKDLYVVNNTFLNDDSSAGTFIATGGTVTTPVLMQNNIFGGVGIVNTQATAIDKTNYRSLSPGFVDRAHFNLHPTDSLVVNSGSAPGVSASGWSLTPRAQYRHSAGGETRPIVGRIDIGAYEAVPTFSFFAGMPVIAFAAPADGASVSQSFTVAARAIAKFGITKMSLFVDAKLVASSATGSLNATLNTDGLVGSHVLVVTAVDAANHQSTQRKTVNFVR